MLLCPFWVDASLAKAEFKLRPFEILAAKITEPLTAISMLYSLNPPRPYDAFMTLGSQTAYTLDIF